MTHSSVAAYSFIGSGRPLGPGDLIWLAALGSATRSASSAESVCHCIETVAAGLWSPSPQLVCDCLDEMARARHLRFFRNGRQDLFAVTPQGRGILSLMLGQPMERPSTTLGQVALRLKLAFLDLASPDDRTLHLTDMIAAHEAELASRPTACGACHAPGCFGRMWSEHHTDTLRREINLLRKMINPTPHDSLETGEGCSIGGLRLNCISN